MQKIGNRRRNVLEKQTRECPATEISFHEGCMEIGTDESPSCFETCGVDVSTMNAPGLSITSTTYSMYSPFTNSPPANSPSASSRPAKKNIPSPYTLPVSIESFKAMLKLRPSNSQFSYSVSFPTAHCPTPEDSRNMSRKIFGAS